MRKLYIILAGTLLLASGCNTTPQTTTVNPPATATTINCPNPSSKPCNGQLPTRTPPTPVSPPAETQTIPKPPAPNNTVSQSDSEFSLTVGQTDHPGNTNTTATLQSVSATAATITYGCNNVTPKTFTLKIGDMVNLKPDCITTLTLVKISGSKATFQVSFVR